MSKITLTCLRCPSKHEATTLYYCKGCGGFFCQWSVSKHGPWKLQHTSNGGPLGRSKLCGPMWERVIGGEANGD